ncbi:hypothetical protein HPG69_013170, partial [Diceros bicornis minor]
ASRAQILDKATEYIQYMRRKNHTHQQDIDDLKRQNALLEQQGALPVVGVTPGIRCLKRAMRSLDWSVLCKYQKLQVFRDSEPFLLSTGKARADQVLCSWGIHFSSSLMEDAIRALEKARSSAQLQTNYSTSENSLYTNAKGSTISAFDGGSDSSSESEPEEPQSRKKVRMEAS